jgi:hypothetical protein
MQNESLPYAVLAVDNQYFQRGCVRHLLLGLAIGFLAPSERYVVAVAKARQAPKIHVGECKFALDAGDDDLD